MSTNEPALVASLTEEDLSLETAVVLEGYDVFGATLSAEGDDDGEEVHMPALVVNFTGYDANSNEVSAKVVMPMDAFPGFSKACEEAIVEYQFGEGGSPLDR